MVVMDQVESTLEGEGSLFGQVLSRITLSFSRFLSTSNPRNAIGE